MRILTILGMERAIDACVRANPHGEAHAIAPETSALADIYGLMIFHGASKIEFDGFVADHTFGQRHVDAVARFYPA